MTELRDWSKLKTEIDLNLSLASERRRNDSSFLYGVGYQEFHALFAEVGISIETENSTQEIKWYDRGAKKNEVSRFRVGTLPGYFTVEQYTFWSPERGSARYNINFTRKGSELHGILEIETSFDRMTFVVEKFKEAGALLEERVNAEYAAERAADEERTREILAMGAGPDEFGGSDFG